MEISPKIKVWQIFIIGFSLVCLTLTIFCKSKKESEIVTSEDFLIALQKEGYNAKIMDTFTKAESPHTFPGFEETCTMAGVMVNGIPLSVYEFESPQDAKNESLNISEDGNRIGHAYISWGKYPHIYQEGKLIVIYVGISPKMQWDLKNIIGEQIAGRQWYYFIEPPKFKIIPTT